MMSPTQKMVSTLFEDDTIKKVRQHFKDGTEIVSNEHYGMSFRLFNSRKGNINLELPTAFDVEAGEEHDFLGIGSDISLLALMKRI